MVDPQKNSVIREVTQMWVNWGAQCYIFVKLGRLVHLYMRQVSVKLLFLLGPGVSR